MQYELLYLVGQKNEERLEKIKQDVSEMLSAEGATLTGEEMTEKRRLAYEIKHESKGTYVAIRFDMPEVDYWADEANAEKESGLDSLNRKLNLYAEILRHLIVRTDELPPLSAKQERQQREMKDRKDDKPQARKERAPRRAMPTKEEKPAAKEEAVQEETPAKTAPSDEKENIDKKLEELLNI
ncbi:MAG TPA: 30S ribosomal protein S6 [Candidatus Moranbacteria bacterium]|nr:30S ribosomal protein S6 [Candidatus Moranbacteria bacterium]